MHGARKASKWSELYTTLDSEAVALYAVAETHLRNLEEPPIHPDWHWAGCNREDGSRKGGGVGVLWNKTTSWMQLSTSCSEHMWVAGSILGDQVLVSVVYLTVARGQHDGNDRTMRCIAEDVKRWATDRQVLLLGDFNGHIEPIDGYQDRNGELLLCCAQELRLEIANLRTDCEGETTWCARNARSTIDYALVSPRLAARITRMHIDEDGSFSLGSDHNRLLLSFSASARHENRLPPQQRPGMRLPSRSFERVAEEFENCPQRRESRTYGEFVLTLRSVMRAHMVQDRREAPKPWNPWWDREVQAAWKARRQANREHRRAMKEPDTEACVAAWTVYLDEKHKVQALVQNKIADHNAQLIQSIRMEGKSAAHKFWTYVRSLDRPSPPPPSLVDATTGQPVAELKEYLTRYFARVFSSSSPDGHTHLVGATASPTAGPTSPLPAGGTQSQADLRWAMSSLTVDRALARISARTAAGPDDMPARLLKYMGAHALHHFENV